jgi:radical SAM-linked protein
MEKPIPAPIQGPQSLQSFQRMLAGPPPESEALERLLADLESERRLEHAWLLCKQARPDPALWSGFQARLKAALEISRTRRMGQWQGDPDRLQLRMRFELRGPACVHHPAGLLALLGRTLMEAGLPVAMGLEKSPRPALHLGHPLPLLAEGYCEWADVALLEPPGSPLEDLPARINACAPEGLRVLQCFPIPKYASKVGELCRQAHWRWSCPPERLDAARERMEAFLRSDRFEMERIAKIAGQKGPKRVDIRPLLEDCQWSGADLLFQTRIAPGGVVNPWKLLAAVLDLEGPVQGLARTQVELAEDPKLAQAEKFEPKLHNMYEDAVLLDSTSHIQLIDDDDDDDPLVLG